MVCMTIYIDRPDGCQCMPTSLNFMKGAKGVVIEFSLTTRRLIMVSRDWYIPGKLYSSRPGLFRDAGWTQSDFGCWSLNRISSALSKLTLW